MLPALSGAASAPQAGTDGGSMVSVSDFPRVLIFEPLRNNVTTDGQLVICPRHHEVSWREPGKCPAEGPNAWMSIQDVRIAGHILSHYEIRMPGSGGSRNLILYFKKQ